MFKSYVVTFGQMDELKATPLREYEFIDLKENPDYEFVPGNRYLCIDKGPYEVIVKKIHLGPRREYHGDLVKMDYLITRSGIVFKFVYLKYVYKDPVWLSKGEYEMFQKNIEVISKKFKGLKLRDGISKKNGKPWYMMEYMVLKDDDGSVADFMSKESYIKPEPKLQYEKIIREKDDVINSFNYFINLPKGTRFGLDYETDGIPFEDDGFRHMGVSIVTADGIGAYFDMDWIQDQDYWDTYLDLYKKFLDKHEKEIYTYNVGFEMRATYLLFKKLYNFQEAGAINKIRGLVTKLYSLKYTAMKELGVRSWDDSFDGLNDIIGEEIFKTDSSGNYIYSPDTYKESPGWTKIAAEYPDEVEEFDRLFHKYWGRHYRCIPYKILGKYCMLDSFHTVLLREASDKLGFSDVCWNTFSDNMRMGAHLNVCGYYVDTKLRSKYRLIEWNMISWARLNAAKLYLRMRLDEHRQSMPNIPGFTNIMELGFNPYDSKTILQKLVDPRFESGINEDKLLEVYTVHYDEVKEILSHYGKINASAFRGRTLFNSLNGLMARKYVMDIDTSTVTYDGVTYDIGNISDTIQYFKWTQQYRLCKHYLEQIDVNKPQSTYKNPDGQDIDVEKLGELALGIYNINSPQDMREFFPNIMHRFINETRYLSTYKYTKRKISIEESSVRPEYNFEIQGDEDWYAKLMTIGKRWISDNRVFMDKYFTKEMAIYDKDGNVFKLFYDNVEKPRNAEDIRYQFFDDKANYEKYESRCEPLGITPWTKSQWDELVKVIYWTSDLLDYVMKKGVMAIADDDLVQNIRDHYNDDDIEELNFRGFAKLQMSYTVARKYYKAFGSYLDGIMRENNCYTNLPDENLVCTEKWHGKDEGNVVLKDYPRFSVCEKKSKRWGAGFHTIPSGDEIKRLVTTPPGYLMSYFDISGAEVRTIAYMSQDEFMLEAYKRNEDPYINCAKVLTPGHDYKYYKGIRWLYKQLLLGSMYGMGIPMIAEKIETTVEDAQVKYDQMFTILKGVKVYMERKSEYCISHGGVCESILGDVLDMSSEPQDRWGRLGINQVIQGFSACALASGFDNIVMEARDTPGLTLMPLSCVHDSCQNYFNIEYLFDINKFYKKNLTEFLYERFGVIWAFDTLIGTNYYDMIDVSNIDDDTLKLGGSYTALTKFFDKINESNLYYRILEKPEKFEPEIEKNLIAGFYNKYRNPFYEDDDSYHNFVITRKPE